jgi:hypothetical protein
MSVCKYNKNKNNNINNNTAHGTYKGIMIERGFYRDHGYVQLRAAATPIIKGFVAGIL